MNRTEKKILKEQNPIIRANFLSKTFFWWLKDIFKIGLKRPIEENEIYEIRDNLESKSLTELFDRLWNEELQRKNPSVLRLLFRAYGLPILLWGLLFAFVESFMRIMQPICLGGLVSYFAPGKNDITRDEAFLYAGGIIFSSCVPVFTFHPFILYIFQLGAKMRLGCTGLIYRKVMKLSKAAVYEGLNGKVINIMSNDLTRFDIALAFMHDVWKGPMEAILFTYFIYREIGLGAVVGMAFLLSFIPLQAWIGKKAAQYRLRTTKRTDFRVKIMNEIILGIQVIKMYTWEKSFAVMVDKIRKKEMNAIKGTAYIRATLFSFGMISRLSIFLSLVSYIYFGETITARKVFIVSSFYNILNLSMVYFWPVALTTVAEGYISAKRVQEFLLASEDKLNSLEMEKPKGKKCSKSSKHLIMSKETVDFTNIDKEGNSEPKENNNGNVVQDLETDEIVPEKRIINDEAVEKGLILENVTAAWEISENSFAGISSLNLKVKQNELCAIVGQVGSGKTTLLQVILGELELDEGLITINGKLSYAAQEPWLFEGSIKSNIIFVEEFDEKRYKEVIRVCALDKDLRLLPNGDATIVGERGISLSGGQKARVNLARTIYKNADIYLLDDPLSAVDTHVGKHIFDECVRVFLQDKICILVTHQLQYLKDVEHLVLMNQGKIEGQGTYEDLRKVANDSFLSIHTTKEDENATADTNKKFERQRSTSSSTISALDEIIEDRQETQIAGAVSMDVYKSYFKSVDSTIYIIFLILMFILAQAAVSGVDYFVAQWVNWEERVVAENLHNDTNTTVSEQIETTTMRLILTKNDTIATNAFTSEYPESVFKELIENDVSGQREHYIILYAILMGIATYIYVHRTFAFFSMCLRASIKLHDRLFRGITRATMYFYNNNPSGRILNRFSKDINSIDSLLPPALMDCLSFFLEFAAVMVLVAIANYWLVIPTIVMIFLFYGIRLIYINTGRSAKRIDSLTRSPVYSHVNATLQGLSTIRVFRAQAILETEFYEHLNHNTSAWFLSTTSTRAFALWLDLVCLVYIAFVTLSFLVLETDRSSGNIGLAILQSVNLIGMCQWGMRQTAEIENQMTSVERVLEYADLPAEPPLQSVPKFRPPIDWPHSGKITFSDLSFRYSENSNFVLKNLNFQINAKEKIGIVGRTGAGKSSLIQALFRLAGLDGSIFIDEIEINSLGLHDLRSKISIIPQDPVLFSGTLRFNLDPFDEKKDEELWNALTQVELKPVVSSLAGGLDCKMSDGGSNFSMGQRQLVCLARAVLRKNKILILDEATANVDPETDKLIQTTIRNKFAGCTVLTIAHRLHTVMDSDRVLVIDAGHVVEYSHPHELLQISDGYFRQLVDQTGPATASALAQAAAQNFQQRKMQNN